MTNNRNTNTKLERELAQFTGSSVFFKHTTSKKSSYTEGVKYLIEKTQAYWLLDHIFVRQLMHRKLRFQRFQVWTLTVGKDKNITTDVTDGNKNHLARFELDFTTFPISPFSLWLIEETILLPSEY